jgi:hypothetical protein
MVWEQEVKCIVMLCKTEEKYAVSSYSLADQGPDGCICVHVQINETFCDDVITCDLIYCRKCVINTGLWDEAAVRFTENTLLLLPSRRFVETISSESLILPTFIRGFP